MRIGIHDWVADKAILNVLIKHKIKAKEQYERIRLHRQLVRTYATKDCQADKIITEYLKPIIDDIDLLSFKDHKNNNVIHLALKTF